MIWSVVHFVITPGHFGAFIMPLRPDKTSDQYPETSIKKHAVSRDCNLGFESLKGVLVAGFMGP